LRQTPGVANDDARLAELLAERERRVARRIARALAEDDFH